MITYPDSKVHDANMGPIWVRQDPGGPHVGPMNLAIWVYDHEHTQGLRQDWRLATSWFFDVGRFTFSRGWFAMKMRLGWIQGWSGHDDIMTWKHFLHYQSFVREIHQSLEDYPHTKGQWYGTLMFYLLLVWTSCYTNSWVGADLRSHDAHVTPL